MCHLREEYALKMSTQSNSNGWLEAIISFNMGNIRKTVLNRYTITVKLNVRVQGTLHAGGSVIMVVGWLFVDQCLWYERT